MTSINLRYVRFIPFSEVYSFLHHVASHVTTVNAQERERSDIIQHALLEACWPIPHIENNPSIELRFNGTAEWYLHVAGLRMLEEYRVHETASERLERAIGLKSEGK